MARGVFYFVCSLHAGVLNGLLLPDDSPAPGFMSVFPLVVKRENRIPKEIH